MSMKTLSAADLEMARKRLRELPQLEPKDRKDLSPTEVLKALRPELKGLERKGYTQAQIHQEVNAAGVDVGLNTVKRLLRGNQRKPRAQSTAGSAAPVVTEPRAKATVEEVVQESAMSATTLVAERTPSPSHAALRLPAVRAAAKGVLNREK